MTITTPMIILTQIPKMDTILHIQVQMDTINNIPEIMDTILIQIIKIMNMMGTTTVAVDTVTHMTHKEIFPENRRDKGQTDTCIQDKGTCTQENDTCIQERDTNALNANVETKTPQPTTLHPKTETTKEQTLIEMRVLNWMPLLLPPIDYLYHLFVGLSIYLLISLYLYIFFERSSIK